MINVSHRLLELHTLCSDGSDFISQLLFFVSSRSFGLTVSDLYRQLVALHFIQGYRNKLAVIVMHGILLFIKCLENHVMFFFSPPFVSKWFVLFYKNKKIHWGLWLQCLRAPACFARCCMITYVLKFLISYLSNWVQ